MTLMTMQQIQRVFDEMRLGTEAERERFRDLAKLGTHESQSFHFIRLDDVSTPEAEEKDNAKLAPAS